MPVDDWCPKTKSGEHKMVPNIRKDKRPPTVEGFRCMRCGQVTGSRVK